MLAAAADEVIVPSYEALVAAFDDARRRSSTRLCTEPSTEQLEAARDAWRELAVAWRHTRAGGVGPAMDRRLASAIAFAARPDAVADLLAGTDPVDEAGVDATGAGVKGIVALEIGLFGDGSEELATPEGSRRCEYLTSVTALARAAAAEVLDDWTGGYRDEFVAGMDGDPQASLDALANEVIFRVTEIDDQGLRALTEATTADELQPTRADGPAAFRLAEHRATYESVAAILEDGPAAGAGRRHQRRHRRAARRSGRGGERGDGRAPRLGDRVVRRSRHRRRGAGAGHGPQGAAVHRGRQRARHHARVQRQRRRLLRPARVVGPAIAVALAVVGALVLTRDDERPATATTTTVEPQPVAVTSDAPSRRHAGRAGRRPPTSSCGVR